MLEYACFMQLMRFKGHNAKCPCRFCIMRAIKHKSGTTTTYYITRKRERAKDNPNYSNLPLRLHEGTAEVVNRIEAESDVEERKLLQETWGINGRVSLDIGNVTHRVCMQSLTIWHAAPFSTELLVRHRFRPLPVELSGRPDAYIIRKYCAAATGIVARDIQDAPNPRERQSQTRRGFCAAKVRLDNDVQGG